MFHSVYNDFSEGDVSESMCSPEKSLQSKPRLEEFLKSFEQQIEEVNFTYKSSK